MKSQLDRNFTAIKVKGRKSKSKSQKPVPVTYKKPKRIWSDAEGRYVDMTENDLAKYKQALKVKASTRGEGAKIKWQSDTHAKFSNDAAAKAIAEHFESGKPLNQQDNGKKKSLWDQMHQKKGSAK
ncbi:hypothetical protein [Burkholderia multivorans]|uniref:hypothetical protein n=1 Tax=Burkholderia multivorans TaxID=87883 RepID=UPI0011B22654|nr:hypothetical protein [Burkholderia multivorans]